MSLLDLFLYVVLVSSSGALSPGPLTVATVRYSLDYGRKAGLLISFGHMTFELPLVIAISMGIVSFINNLLVKFLIGFAGSTALIFFGLIEVRSFFKYRRQTSNSADILLGSVNDRRYSLTGRKGFIQAILVGFIFTSLNPYFIIWWMSIGLTLIVSFLAYASLIGILIMYIFHVWIDYAWLGFISYVTYSGKRFLKPIHIRIVSLALSIIIILLGVYLLSSVISEFAAP
jgi:threonine/homoserine/homoserine lactone efflux protein